VSSASLPEHGLVTGHVFLKPDLVAGFAVSLLLHLIFFYLWAASKQSARPIPLSLQRGTQFQVEVMGVDLGSGSSRQALSAATWSAADERQLAPVDSAPSNSRPAFDAALETEGVEQSVGRPPTPDQPIQGLSMGAMARLDWGGGRRGLFSTLGVQGGFSSVPVSPAQASGLTHPHVAQAMISDLTEDLNRKFPSALARSCRLSQQSECSPSDEEVQQFLSRSYPSLAQVLGSRFVWLTTDQGVWRAQIEP